MKIDVRYILYKRLYDLIKRFRGAKIFESAGYIYLFREDSERVKEINYLIKRFIGLEPEENYIYDKNILDMINRYKNQFTEPIARARSEINKILSSISGFSSLIEQSINPIINLLKKIDVDIQISRELPRPETFIILREGSVVRGLRIRGAIVKERRRSLIDKFLGLLSSARIVTLESGDISRVVEKRYLSVSSVKWLFSTPVIEILRRIGVSMTTDPLERLLNDYYYSLKLREEGLKTPRIIYIDPWNYILVREFIDGISLVEYLDLEKEFDETSKICELLGEQIASIHSRNICLGDSNPRNILIKQINNSKEIFFIDLEQASRCEDPTPKAWDLSMLLYFTYLLRGSKNHDIVRRCFETLINKYFEKLRDKETIMRIDDPVFLSIFMTTSSIIFSPLASTNIYKAYAFLSDLKKRSIDSK